MNTHCEKHSPSPWYISQLQSGEYVVSIHNGPAIVVGKDQKANASVMAAAPLLFDLLNESIVVGALQNHDSKLHERALILLDLIRRGEL